MKKTSLLLTLLMLMCYGMAKAETVTIELGASGGTETTDRRLPTWIYYKYTLTQQIYTPHEIDFIGNISSVGFYNTSATMTRTIDLYLVIPDKTSFSGSNDWIPFTEADKMFSGDVTFTQNEWTKISFQNGKRLYHADNDNLAVILVDRTGTYISASAFFKAYTADSQALSISSDDTQFSANGLSGRDGTILDVKNQIRLWGQDDPFIVGPSRSYVLPTDALAQYTFSEQIYTKDEIGKSGTIKSIAFYSKTADGTRNIDLWLGTTSKNTFSNSYDWLKSSETGAVKVFSGNVNFTPGEWTTITFTKPFNYNGKSNLVVFTDDNTGSYDDEYWFYTYEGTNQALCVPASNDVGFATIPCDGDLEKVKNRIKLVIEEGGSTPEPSVIEIGDGGTATTGGLPSAVNWKYSMSQQIYTVEEIGKTGPITSIAFKPMKGPAQARTFNVYLVETDKSSFSNKNEWVRFSESDKVFSGSVDLVNGEWATLSFSRPFNYSGGGNLCVITIDETGSYIQNTSIDWLVYSASRQSNIMYNDNNPYDPSSLTFSETGYFKNFKNQIQLGFNSGSGFDPNADPEIVEIGSGESIDECLPTCTRYKYGLSEQIYTKEEIGKSGIITSIAFLNGVGMMETRSLDIYMVQTDKKGFASSTDVISVSESDKVFSGDVTFAMYDWETIKLNTPFNYDGTSNLAIIVDDNTKRSEQYELKFTVFNSSPNCTAYVYSNNTNYDPANTSNYSYALEGYKNCIQLGIIAGPDPGQVTKTVQIGNAQTSDYNLPVNTYYNYSLTQQIYTAAEIGTEGTITAIAFDYAHSEELSMSGVQMYMKNVSKSKFDSKSDMVSVGASDLVWEGTLSASEAGWMTITLDKPFKYDGKSNLLLCLYDPTNGYPGSTYTFRNTETEETRTLAYWSDSNAPDLGSLTSFSGGAGMKTYRSNIKLYIQTTGSGPGLDFIDFETGDFSQFKFQNDSDYPWIVTNATAADGTYCMRSGNAGVASSSSFITATRTYEEDGYVCFDAKCMGEGTSWDVCNFYIDGEVQFSYGALGNYWAFYYYPVTAGTHTFKWEYKKDGSTDPVGDAFFVDNIRFLEEGRDDDVIVGVSPIGETEEGAAIYNLAGQRLSKMQKGINITGGRKILVK